jgi:hypothetical protein
MLAASIITAQITPKDNKYRPQLLKQKTDSLPNGSEKTVVTPSFKVDSVQVLKKIKPGNYPLPFEKKLNQQPLKSLTQTSVYSTGVGVVLTATSPRHTGTGSFIYELGPVTLNANTIERIKNNEPNLSLEMIIDHPCNFLSATFKYLSPGSHTYMLSLGVAGTGGYAGSQPVYNIADPIIVKLLFANKTETCDGDRLFANSENNEIHLLFNYEGLDYDNLINNSIGLSVGKKTGMIIIFNHIQLVRLD